MEEKGLRVRSSKSLNFLWITDFPLFAKDENNTYITNHHPFTAPRPEDEPLLFTNPSQVKNNNNNLNQKNYQNFFSGHGPTL